MRRRALWLLLLGALPAHADLYRWIDPDTGSVKLSSMPPSDPRISAEVVPFRAPPPPKPPTQAIVTKPAATLPVPALEGRWRELLAQLTGLTPQDFNRGADGLRQHMDAYESVRAELDRMDPAGAARRNAESATLLQRLRQGFAAQFSPTPPVQR
jgi:hypothetical protein